MSFPLRARYLSIAITTACHGSMALAADIAPSIPSAAATQTRSQTAIVAPANPAEQPGKKPEAQELDSVTVKGKRDLLGESEARLRKLKESLPDLSSDVGHKETLTQRVVDAAVHYLGSHTDPNKLSDDSKTMIEQMQSPLDSTHDAGKPPVAQPDARDYVDPLCQTGYCPP